MLGQILRELPDTQVVLLLRGDARKRLEDEVLTSAPCEGLDASRVSAINGDVADDNLTVPGQIDTVIHCAATRPV